MLSPQDRQKLDGIVLKMSENNESPADIQFVVDDFKKKYESQVVTPAQQIAKEPETFMEKAGGFVKDVARDITKPVVQTLAAPAQLAAYGIDKATGGNSPVEDFSFTMPFWGEISPAKTKEEAVGRGVQTVALGLGPVSGGAAFMGGQAMTENKGVGGVALDTVIGGVTGKVGEVATKSVGTVLSKSGKAMQTAGAGYDALINSAKKNYETVLGPTTKANKRITQQITGELAERQVTATTRQELWDKAAGQVEKYGEQIQEFYKALPEDTKVKTDGILKAIDAAKRKLFVKGEGAYMVPEVNKALFKKYQDLQIEIMSMAKNGNAPIEGVRALRQALDKSIAKTTSTFGITGEESIITEARKGVSNILRNELAKQFPDVAVINKEFTFWSRVQQVLGDTIERKVGQGTPLGEKIMTAAGGAAGIGSGGVSTGISTAIGIKYLYQLTKSTAWQTLAASMKTKLANALVEGDGMTFSKVMNDILKASGYVIEKTGNILKATPEVLKNAPRKDIPGTSRINLKQKTKTALDNVKRKGGLSIEDVSKKKDSFVYHETSKANLKKIQEEGLIPSKGMYGKGVYFSPKVGGGEASARGLLVRAKRGEIEKIGFNDFGDEGWTEKNVSSKVLEFSSDGGKTWFKSTSDLGEKVAILENGRTKIVRQSQVPKGVDAYSLKTGEKISTVLDKKDKHIFDGLVKNIQTGGSGMKVSELNPVDFDSFKDTVKTKEGRATVDYLKEKILNGEKPKIKIKQGEDGKIFVEDGHHTVQAYKELGYNNIPIEKNNTTTVLENPLLREIRKYKSAEEFVKAQSSPTSRFEYHLSTDSNLPEGKTFGDLPKSNEAGVRGGSGSEVFSSKNPAIWHSQLGYEGLGKTPDNVYLVEVKNPQTTKMQVEGGIPKSLQTSNVPSDVRIVKNLGKVDGPFDAGLFEFKKDKALTDLWKKAHGEKFRTADPDADPLKEIRKYKSAEEFGNASPSYYHVTDSSNVSSIEKGGFSGKVGERSIASHGDIKEGTFLYPDKSSADGFSKNFKNPATVEAKVNGKVYDANKETKYGWEDNLQTQEIARDPKILAQLKKDGYVGVTSTEQGTPATFVFDKSSLKTKSQLTDIWKKVNKGKTRIDTIIAGAAGTGALAAGVAGVKMLQNNSLNGKTFENNKLGTTILEGKSDAPAVNKGDEGVNSTIETKYDSQIEKAAKKYKRIPSGFLKALIDQESSMGENKTNEGAVEGKFAWLVGFTDAAKKELERNNIPFNLDTEEGAIEAAAAYIDLKKDYRDKTGTVISTIDDLVELYVDRYNSNPNADKEKIAKLFKEKLKKYL